MNAEDVLDRFVSMYGWEVRRIRLFEAPALSVYAGRNRLTVIPVRATDLQQMVELDSFPAAWDFVHGQIILAIAGRLSESDYQHVWKKLRRSHFIDLWLDENMRAIAARNAAEALGAAGIFLLVPD